MSAFETVMRLGLGAVHLSQLDRLASRFVPRSGVIFALHRVKPAEPKGTFAPNALLEVTPEFLDATITTVRRQGFDIVSMDEAVARLNAPAQRPFACFTFDDAYRDNKEHALPVLEKRGVPFTVYVPEHFADGFGQLWWVELERAIAASNTLSVPELFSGETLACATVDEKYKTYRKIYWRIRCMDETAARQLVRTLCARPNVDISNVCADLIMTWDELRQMAKSPLATFGAHTVTHFALAKLPAAAALHEMRASKARVEIELQRAVRHFCYPYGDEGSASKREFDLANQAGFASAVTMKKGLVEARHRDSLTALPRCSLNGAYQDQRLVSALLSGLPFLLWNLVSRPKTRVKPSPAVEPSHPASEARL